MGAWPKTNLGGSSTDPRKADDDDFNEVLEGAYNVRAYGAVPDVLTSAQASLNATAFAYGLQDAAAKGKAFYMPAGTYFMPVTHTPGNAIPIPANTNWIGRGRNTVLKLDPASYTGITGGALLATFQGDNITLSKFRVDGTKAAISGVGSHVQSMLFTKGILGAMDNLVCEHLWMHDIFTLVDESFGIALHNASVSGDSLITGAVTNVVVRHCRGWNVGGSPFSLNGYVLSSTPASWASGYLTDGILVDDVVCWNNDVQGITFYGAKNARLVNSKFYGNAFNGINAEWTQNLFVWNCEAYGNTHAGFNMDGPVNAVLQNSNIHDNNTGNSSVYAEIVVQSGVWYLGSPAPASGGGQLEIRNNRVAPAGSNKHLRMTRDAVNLNFGIPIPQSVIIQQDDVASWSIGDGGATGQYFCTTHQGGPPVIGVVHLGRQIDWTTPSLTLAAYSAGGNIGSDPIKLTGTTANQRAFSSKGPLMPGRTYRIRARIKPEDANGTWGLYVVEHNGGTNQITLGTHQPVASQIGSWVQLDIIATISSTWQPCHVQINRTDTGTSSTLDVDYITAEELDVGYNLSERTFTTANAINLTYSASMTPDLIQAEEFFITATNGTAFTINAPLNPVLRSRIRIRVRNNSGGALGTITWDAVYKKATFTAPANQFSRTIEFEYDGTNWIEQTPGVDIPL